MMTLVVNIKLNNCSTINSVIALIYKHHFTMSLLTSKFFVVLLISCASLAFANSLNRWNTKSRIIGGSSAVKGQFPYQVSLREIYSHKHFCGGAIIHEHFILTAGHCFFQFQFQSLSFYGIVNKTDATDEGIRVEFRGVIPHPDFGVMGPKPDIALIITKDRLIFTDFVKPVKLPTQNHIESGTRAVISGWGISKVFV